MRLSELAAGFGVDGEDREISAVTEDSRKALPGSLFVAVTGTAEDGHAYIRDAVARGAAAIAANDLRRYPHQWPRPGGRFPSATRARHSLHGSSATRPLTCG